jgi:sulfatase modifying factor 1
VPARGTAAIVAVAVLAACGGKTERDFGGSSATGDSRGSGGSYSDAWVAAGGAAGGWESAGGDANSGDAPSPPETCRGPGMALCGGECVSLLADNLNCGTCGNGCEANQVCTNGFCECSVSGETLCGTECVDTNTDPNNCGGCGSTCSGGCASGECIVYGPEGPSCAGGLYCSSEGCCTSIVLPGGSYSMGRSTETCTNCTAGCPRGMDSCSLDEEPEHPATVSRFALDKYEVTVGRFRRFVDAGAGTQANPPEEGAGAHPLISGSGWDSAWNTNLPADQAGLLNSITCSASDDTWTPTAGPNETYPMNCVNWYEAFAFCIWDGGRLPTEAEWEYAAAGGDENRVFPWGNDVADPLPANYLMTEGYPFFDVGSYPDGNGRWGHADLAGSMWEWVLDWYASDYYTTTESGCSDCANLFAASDRVYRGGAWAGGAAYLRAASRAYFTDSPGRLRGLGWRCARSAP